MKSLKSHLFLILGLVSIFFSIEVYTIIDKVVEKYEKQIVNHYTILVVSEKPLSMDDFRDIKEISKLESVDISRNLVSLKKELKSLNFEAMQKKLPYFYKLYFNKFLTPDELNEIEDRLIIYPQIRRVESFKKNQNQIYNLLTIVKVVIAIFMTLISIISTLLIIKQLEVWRLEHIERIYIMELFGASFLLKSAILLKLAILDSFFSFLILLGIFEYMSISDFFQQFLLQLNIFVEINPLKDSLTFFGYSLLLSIVATLIVSVSKKEEFL